MTDLLKTNSSVPSAPSRLSVTIASTLVDMNEGLSTTEIIWGATPNLKYLGQALSDETVRSAVSEFFLNRHIGETLRNLITVQFIRPHETAFTKHDLFSALTKTVTDAKVCGAIMELVLPAMIKIGFISAAINYSRQLDYGFGEVSVRDIANEVLVFQAAEAAKTGVLKFEGKDRVSKTVFAEAVADSFRDVGLAIEEMMDMSGIVDDFVLGVRAHLDPQFIIDKSSASVPAEWRNHRVVAELATNLVFVKAAMGLPTGQALRLKTEMYNLEKYASAVMSTIKSSDRYRWVSKEEAIASYSITKIRDIGGRPVTAVVGRNAEVQAVGQAVFAIPDVSMPNAQNINATKDRIAESIQLAYGKASFSLIDGAEMMADNLRDYVESGWKGSRAVYVADTSNGLSVQDLAVLLADVLHVTVSNGQVVIDPKVVGAVETSEEEKPEGVVTWAPRWWYTIMTNEKSLRVWSGQHLGDRIITEDPAEVILACNEREARTALPARQQLLSPQAFNTRLLSFNQNRMISVSARFSFSVTIAGLAMRGALRALDFASLRSSVHTALVKPHFNDEVIRGLQQVFSKCADIDNMIQKSSAANDWEHGKIDKDVSRFVRARYARRLLNLAQKLDPAFRHEVQQVMIERAVHSNALKGSDADLMRARMQQKSFMAYCDVVALLFFLHLQGIDHTEFTSISTSKEMTEVCMEHGSDRSK